MMKTASFPRFSGEKLQFDALKPGDVKPGQLLKVEQPNDTFSGGGGTRYFLVQAVGPDGQPFGQEVKLIKEQCRAGYSRAESFEIVA